MDFHLTPLHLAPYPYFLRPLRAPGALSVMIEVFEGYTTRHVYDLRLDAGGRMRLQFPNATAMHEELLKPGRRLRVRGTRSASLGSRAGAGAGASPPGGSAASGTAVAAAATRAGSASKAVAASLSSPSPSPSPLPLALPAALGSALTTQMLQLDVQDLALAPAGSPPPADGAADGPAASAPPPSLQSRLRRHARHLTDTTAPGTYPPPSVSPPPPSFAALADANQLPIPTFPYYPGILVLVISNCDGPSAASPDEVSSVFFDAYQSFAGWHNTCSYGQVHVTPENTTIREVCGGSGGGDRGTGDKGKCPRQQRQRRKSW